MDPDTAFRVFTEEIGSWYRGGAYSWNDPARAVGIRFEPGVGGRWIEVWDEQTGEGFELGRVTAWEPGRRLTISYRAFDLPPQPRTEIEVTFRSVPGGTKVTLEHRGLDLLPPAMASRWQQRAWAQFMEWFQDYMTPRR